MENAEWESSFNVYSSYFAFTLDKDFFNDLLRKHRTRLSKLKQPRGYHLPSQKRLKVSYPISVDPTAVEERSECTYLPPRQRINY